MRPDKIDHCFGITLFEDGVILLNIGRDRNLDLIVLRFALFLLARGTKRGDKSDWGIATHARGIVSLAHLVVDPAG